MQDADRISYLRQARSIVSDIRSSLEDGKYDIDALNDNIIVHAEEFLEDQIVKLASGDWAFVGKE